LNPEGWGSTLVQEKFQEKKTCDKKQINVIIIIIIIIIIITMIIIIIIIIPEPFQNHSDST